MSSKIAVKLYGCSPVDHLVMCRDEYAHGGLVGSVDWWTEPNIYRVLAYLEDALRSDLTVAELLSDAGQSAHYAIAPNVVVRGVEVYVDDRLAYAGHHHEALAPIILPEDEWL